MGKANRERRKAKEKARRQRSRPGGGGRAASDGSRPPWSFAGTGHSPEERASALVSDAVHAQVCRETGRFEECAAALIRQAGGRSGRVVVERTLWTARRFSIEAAWRNGWQPAEVVRHVRREFTTRHMRMAVDAIAAQMREYAAATLDERWEAQLAAMGAAAWWGRDSDYLERWRAREDIDYPAMMTCTLQTLAVLATLPKLPVLCPLPGKARRGSLDPGRTAGRAADTRTLDRVRALLDKAESTEFPAEAEALTGRAQELMARHSIDYALLAAREGDGEKPSARRIPVDNPYADPKAVLLDVVAGSSRCRTVWDIRLGLCTVLGFPGDLEAVELMFTSLLVQATAAMVAAGSHRDHTGKSRTRSFRQSFLLAYAQRIDERLMEATGTAQRQAVAESPGTDLVPLLTARGAAVDDATHEMFPDMIQQVSRVNNDAGYVSGRAAADLAALHPHQHLDEHNGA